MNPVELSCSSSIPLYVGECRHPAELSKLVKHDLARKMAIAILGEEERFVAYSEDHVLQAGRPMLSATAKIFVLPLLALPAQCAASVRSQDSVTATSGFATRFLERALGRCDALQRTAQAFITDGKLEDAAIVATVSDLFLELVRAELAALHEEHSKQIATQSGVNDGATLHG